MLCRAYATGIAIQSDTSRTFSQTICAMASMALISTHTTSGYGRVWRVTEEGLAALKRGKL